MYFKIPMVNGLLDIDYEDMLEGIMFSETESYVKVQDSATVRDSWAEITEEEFNTKKAAPYEIIPQKTTRQQIEELKQNQLILMDAIATLYETMNGGV